MKDEKIIPCCINHLASTIDKTLTLSGEDVKVTRPPTGIIYNCEICSKIALFLVEAIKR
jgi:hypothetical protein